MTIDDFLSQEDKNNIVKAISNAEKSTNGEIRVHIEQKSCTDEIQRAKEVFNALEMYNTKDKTGVLFYINIKDNKIAIIGDTGINKKVSTEFWKNTIDIVISDFKKGYFAQGIINGIKIAEEELSAYFPKTQDNTDELSNEISIGDV